MSTNKLLVIDDDIKINHIFSEFFTRSGFEVTTALGGVKGMEIISSQEKFNLLILDLGMPKINGADILINMLNINKMIPTIIVTGSFDVIKYSDALAKAAIPPEYVLFKPVDLFLLLNKVNELIQKQTKAVNT